MPGHTRQRCLGLQLLHLKFGIGPGLRAAGPADRVERPARAVGTGTVGELSDAWAGRNVAAGAREKGSHTISHLYKALQ